MLLSSLPHVLLSLIPLPVNRSRSAGHLVNPNQPTDIVSVVFLADIRKTLTLPENKSGQILLELSIAVFPNASGNGEEKKKIKSHR